ncbi:hypothetical protein [Serratia quinivorans]
MKKITTLVFILFFLCGFFYYHYQINHNFRCDTQLISHIEQDGIKIHLNINTNIVFTLHNEGTFYFTGSLKVGNQEYIVSRATFITTKQAELSSMKKTTITREEINNNDTVPEGLWQRYILPRTIGTAFYTKMTSVNSNGVLFQGLSNPFFVCAREEN